MFIRDLQQIQGIVPIGTSMDDESEATRRKGSWDAHAICDPYLDRWSSPTPTPDFVIDEDWCRNVPALAFGDGSTPEALQFWYDTWRTLYSGDEGRKKARSAVSCLVERDGLLPKLPDVKCPVHWLHVSIPLVASTIISRSHFLPRYDDRPLIAPGCSREQKMQSGQTPWLVSRLSSSPARLGLKPPCSRAGAIS